MTHTRTQCKLRWICLAVLLTVLMMCFSGCKDVQASARQDSLLGKWQDAYGLTDYEFQSGGKMKIKALELGSLNGTYTLDGDKITMEYSVMVKKVNDTYTYRLEDGTLYLNDEEFKRKIK